jgi:hypothetical protein
LLSLQDRTGQKSSLLRGRARHCRVRPRAPHLAAAGGARRMLSLVPAASECFVRGSPFHRARVQSVTCPAANQVLSRMRPRGAGAHTRRDPRRGGERGGRRAAAGHGEQARRAQGHRPRRGTGARAGSCGRRDRRPGEAQGIRLCRVPRRQGARRRSARGSHDGALFRRPPRPCRLGRRAAATRGRRGRRRLARRRGFAAWAPRALL